MQLASRSFAARWNHPENRHHRPPMRIRVRRATRSMLAALLAVPPASAAAVADHMAALALGSQTTASTIRPAAFCGVVGYRPTWGDLRLSGVMEAVGSVDTLGLIARSIEDISLLRDVLLGVEPKPLPTEVPKPRIGFCRTPLWEHAESSTQRLLEDTASRLTRAGAAVKDAVLPSGFTRIPDAHRAVSSFEFTRNFTWEIAQRWNDISEALRNGRLKHGLACTFERYREAREFLAACRNTLDQFFDNYDVLLTPAAAGEAPVGLHSTGDAQFCVIWTSTHVPAVTIPLSRGPNDADRCSSSAGVAAPRTVRRRRWMQRALG
jgi:amidase